MGKKNTKETLADETNQLVREIIVSGIDAIIGGFPCQDASVANSSNPQGINGERTGLWRILFRTIRLVRPRIVLLENVAALLNRGVGKVFGDLANIGYDCEWHCLRASDFGMPHERDRLYIIAHPMRQRLQRNFPKKIQGQLEFRWWQAYRVLEELPKRHDLYPSQLCRGDDGARKRLHGIGNANPPCVIRELTRGLK